MEWYTHFVIAFAFPFFLGKNFILKSSLHEVVLIKHTTYGEKEKAYDNYLLYVYN